MTTLQIPHKPRRGERFEVLVEELDDRGAGVATLEVEVGGNRQPMSLSFHVHRGVPGDVALVEVGQARRRRVDAAIVELREPSPMRIAPRCRHFVSDEHPGCGGCTLQSLDLRHQLAVKERRLKRLFSRARLDPGLVEVVEATSDGWYYRNKMEFSFTGGAGDLHLGLHPAGYRYESVDQRECFLMSPFVSDFVPKVRDWAASLGMAWYDGRRDEGWLRGLVVREGKRTGERLVALVTTHRDGSAEREKWADASRSLPELASSEDVTAWYWTEHRAVRGTPTTFVDHHLAGSTRLREVLRVGDRELEFEIHPRAFFQTNTVGAEVLYGIVVEEAALRGGETVLDLYCGTGTIGLCLASRAERVLGIEWIEEAVDDARANAARNDLSNTEFIAGDVANVLEERRPRADVVVVDPPRKGLGAGAFAALEAVAARRLVYVSCNPEALVRDLPALANVGWEVDRVRPVDMFPQTMHVETVVSLERARS